MAQKPFLPGKGERLTTDINMKFGGGPKQAPYSFTEARERLAKMLTRTAAEIDRLPPEACPGDQAIISLALNPEYIAKSYIPSKLLDDVGVKVVGSRPRTITPEKRSRGREAVEALTTELFALGRRSTIKDWSESLPSWHVDHPGAKGLVSIEHISAPVPGDKVKRPLPDLGRVTLEAVLHACEKETHERMLQAFASYLEWCGIEAKFGRHFNVRGLCFLGMDAPSDHAYEIAAFTGVRALRKMPDLRVL